MDRRDVHAVVREFRSIRKQVDDLERRRAATILTGRVAAIDGDRVRLELQPVDARTGKRFLSPWVQVQEAAGATGTHFPVRIGDPMRLLSPQGELGPQSLAIRDGYTSDAPNPSGHSQEEMVLAFGGAEIRFRGGEVEIVASGGVSIQSGGEVKISSGELTHNGTNVGDTHRHGGVLQGANITSEPV